MRILGIDCAGNACAVCVWQDGEVLAVYEEYMKRGQDTRLMPLMLEVMAKAKADFSQLDRIAVTRGPGSFTGIRIGIAAARGCGLASGKPVVGIDRFSIYSWQNKTRNENLLVVLDSRRSELFCRFYPIENNPHEAKILSPENIATLAKQYPRMIVCGDANDILCQYLPASVIFSKRSECEVITCAALAAQANLDNTQNLPRPFYLRAPDVTIYGDEREHKCRK